MEVFSQCCRCFRSHSAHAIPCSLGPCLTGTVSSLFCPGLPRIKTKLFYTIHRETHHGLRGWCTEKVMTVMAATACAAAQKRIQTPSPQTVPKRIQAAVLPPSLASEAVEGSSYLAQTDESVRSHLVSWSFVGKAPSYCPNVSVEISDF